MPRGLKDASRAGPNILVTGTPGTGKTTLCELLSASLGGQWRHVNVGQLVAEKGLHDGRDEEFDTFLLNEDKVVDEMEEMMQQGFNVVDFHSCDFFPQRWFDLVVVLRSDNSILYDRLQTRGYSEKKVSENIECEIMQVVLEEARESYDESIVTELPSNSVEDMENNVNLVRQWIEQHA